MSIIDTIKERRSIRRFTQQQLSQELIKQIINAAAYAPSWKNTQVTKYIVIQNKALIDQIADEGMLGFTYNTNTLHGVQTLVVVTTDKMKSGYEKDGSFSTIKEDRWEVFDAGIATQTFLLAAAELGVGTVVMGIFDEDYIRRELNVSQDKNIAALIAVGYAAQEPTAPKRNSVDELVEFVL